MEPAATLSVPPPIEPAGMNGVAVRFSSPDPPGDLVPTMTTPAAATTSAAPQQLTINLPVLFMLMFVSSWFRLHSETGASRAGGKAGRAQLLWPQAFRPAAGALGRVRTGRRQAADVSVATRCGSVQPRGVDPGARDFSREGGCRAP
jgi:hypothetical protein